MSAWRRRLRAVVREPLVHFAAAALALFALYGGVAQEDEEYYGSIVVDRSSLLTYLQYRANAFQSDYFSRQFDDIPAEERRRLAREYARSEVLYREAQALGLAQGDYVIRQRMIQKIKYLLGDFALELGAPDEEELLAWFEEHAEDYAVAPSLTFTHVFFDAARRGGAAAREQAEGLLAHLADSGSGFHDAGGQGERFPFFRHYVERTPDYVASHFGAAFAAEIAMLTPSAQRWQGPIASEHGSHLVMLTQIEPRRIPRLEEIRSRVEEDLQRERTAAALEAAIADVVDRYDVELSDDLGLPSAVFDASLP